MLSAEGRFAYSIADDFIIEHVQERIQIKLVQGQMSLWIYFKYLNSECRL